MTHKSADNPDTQSGCQVSNPHFRIENMDTKKPIGPTAHGLIDYAFVAMQLLAPSVFGLKGVARTLSYGNAAFTGIVNSLSDTPVGMKRIIPFRVHGLMEYPFVPLLLLLPWATGAMNQPRAARWFIAFFVMAATNLLLTDYNAYEPETTSG